jgi:uncharacterized membrane protein
LLKNGLLKYNSPFFLGSRRMRRPKATNIAIGAGVASRLMEDQGMSAAIDAWHQRRMRHHHQHPPIANVNELDSGRMEMGDRAADLFASAVGSWRFIIIQSIILAFWIILNVTAWIEHWDPYPFILLNLALSFQAAYAAPIIMMSQNRQSAKDRLMAEQDYSVNMKAEDELKAVMKHLETQDDLMLEILQRLEQQHKQLIDHFLSLPVATTPPAS